MSYSIITEKLLTKNFEYPIIAWSEINDKSEILLINSPTEIFSLIKSKHNNLKDLIQTIKTNLNIRDFDQALILGDEIQLIERIDDLDENNFHWNQLTSAINRQYNNEENQKNLSHEIIMELKKNLSYDLAISGLTSIHTKMLNLLIDKGVELGVAELMFIGQLYAENLSKVIDQNLPEQFNVCLINL